MSKITLYTIGFTKKKAQEFFPLLKKNKVQKIIDVRLNNVSQLAGFAKRNDLIYFLKELCDCDYIHKPNFAPTKDILDGYKKKLIDWNEYVRKFHQLINNRIIENEMPIAELDNSCLLCSEPTSEKCHRRLVAEYLKNKHGNIKIIHL
jgi:uncharacterized protein (DUF488 family)